MRPRAKENTYRSAKKSIVFFFIYYILQLFAIEHQFVITNFHKRVEKVRRLSARLSQCEIMFRVKSFVYAGARACAHAQCP